MGRRVVQHSRYENVLNSFPYRFKSLQELQHAAEVQGCDLVVAKEDELTLDLDNVHGLPFLHESAQWEIICDVYGSYILDVWVSPSGTGTHVLIKLGMGRQSVDTLVALEVFLGSDTLRGLLCLAELKDLGCTTRCLFKPKNDRHFVPLPERVVHDCGTTIFVGQAHICPTVTVLPHIKNKEERVR